MTHANKSGSAESGLLTGWLVIKRIEAARPFIVGRVLDFACGPGHLAKFCDLDGYHGYDIEPHLIAMAKERFPRYQFGTEVSESARYDTIAALAFIEHVEPEPYLQQFSSMLSENGRIVLTTPHPMYEWAHTLGARAHLFSWGAHEDHEGLIPAS